MEGLWPEALRLLGQMDQRGDLTKEKERSLVDFFGDFLDLKMWIPPESHDFWIFFAWNLSRFETSSNKDMAISTMKL